jgi:hypothetical protein
MIAAAGARVAFDGERLDFARTHPALYFFRVDPRRKDFGGRRFEPPLEGEARFGAWLGGWLG